MAIAQPERRGPQVLNIGEVLAQLSDDFPAMTASKIRFLEEKGLINPKRTPPGTASTRKAMWSAFASSWRCNATSTCR